MRREAMNETAHNGSRRRYADEPEGERLRRAKRTAGSIRIRTRITTSGAAEDPNASIIAVATRQDTGPLAAVPLRRPHLGYHQRSPAQNRSPRTAAAMPNARA